MLSGTSTRYRGENLNPAELLDRPTAEFRLPNGLTLLVRPDDRAPVVTIVTHVRAGYFDESDDVVGISHVLEHMFFKGTPTRGPGEIGRATKAAGGVLNASTIYHRTLYYTVLPATSFEEGLALQADALINASIDADELASELRVICEEARRKFDNPGAVAHERLFELLFDVHRMRRWRIGDVERLARLTRSEVHDFYRAHYRGPNIVLVVAGAVQPERVHALVAREYADLPGGAAPRDRGPVEPARTEGRYRELSGDIASSYLEWGWHTPGTLHRDTPALDMLAVVLGNGRASRFYRSLREGGLAHAIDAYNYTLDEPGVFGISAQANPGEERALIAGIASQLRAVQEREVDASELQRARNIVEARLLRRVETAEGQANLLAEWQALGDWRLAREHYEQLLAVTTHDLQRVARTYLPLERAALLLYRPTAAQPVAASVDGISPLLATAAASDTPPPPPLAPVVRAPRAARRVGKEADVRFYDTEGGASVAVLPMRGSGLVAITAAFAGGSIRESPELTGATGLLARASIKGTERYTAAQLAELTELLGGAIGADAGTDFIEWRISVPAQHLKRAVELLMEAALRPTLPAPELERERKAALTAVELARDDMFGYPLRLALHEAFGDHPYGRSLEAHEHALRSLTRDDVASWHARAVAVRAPTIVVAGDVDPDAAAGACATELGDVPTQAAAAVRRPAQWTGGGVRVVERAKAQTALAIAFPGPRRNQRDAHALELLSQAVGGLGGRLFEELRSRRSLAYTVATLPVARRHGGSFVGYIATSPAREDEARTAFLAEIEKLRTDHLSPDELASAKRYAIGARRIRLQTTSAMRDELTRALLLGKGVQELEQFERRIERMTAETLRAAAEKWLDAGLRTEGIVRGR